MRERKHMTPYPRSEVQGLLLSGYRGWRHATYLFFAFPAPAGAAAARSWLGALAERTTFGEDEEGEARRNVAITASGVAALGVSQAALETFAPAFREGMDSPRRSRILGDDDPEAPAWHWGRADQRVDVALLLFHRSEAGHAQQVADEKAKALAAGLRAVYDLPLQTLPETRAGMHEPFGFADGLSQPVFDGISGADELSEESRLLHKVEVGEFILGYKNAFGEKTSVPRVLADERADAFGLNGSYLVLRQLEQDVAGFWSYFKKQAGSGGPLAAERLAAKAVGRWRNGSPISEHPDAPGPDLVADARENEFSYAASDPRGESCPLGAHIRRSNPRDSFPGERKEIVTHVNHHRLLRRGRAYGPRVDDAPSFAGDAQERGLVFACLNGNIERQFEFVQHSWCNNPNFHDLHEEVDPVIGAQPPEGGNHTIHKWPLRRRLSGLGRFVTMRGGAYFFLPGRAGLLQLASLHGAADAPPRVPA